MQEALLQCKQLPRLSVSLEASPSSSYILAEECPGLIAELVEQLPELRALQWLNQQVSIAGDPDIPEGPKHYTSDFVRAVVREHSEPGLVLLQTDSIQVQDVAIKADRLEYLSASNL